MIICLFCPVMSANVRAQYQGKSSKSEASINIDAYYFENMIFDEDTKDSFIDTEDLKEDEKKAVVGSLFVLFEGYKASEVNRGAANALNTFVLEKLMFIDGKYKTAPLFVLVPLFYLAALVFVSIILWQSALYICIGKHKNKLVCVSKILCIILSALSLVLTVIFLTTASKYADLYIPYNYKLTIGGGVILAVVFAITMLFVPSRPVKKEAKGNSASSLYDLY